MCETDAFAIYATRGLLSIMESSVREGIRLYEKAEKLAPNKEWKRLVRQKKYVELGRHYLAIANREESERALKRVVSIDTRSQVYIMQAQRLLSCIDTDEN
jgi:hypothetical protein